MSSRSAMTSSTSLMVPEDQLTCVSGMNSTLQGILTFVSPALGASLLAVLHVQGILAIDMVTAALAIVPLFFVHMPQPPGAALTGTEDAPAPRRSIFRDLAEGSAMYGTNAGYSFCSSRLRWASCLYNLR